VRRTNHEFSPDGDVFVSDADAGDLPAQPDFMRQARPVAPAQADPAIVRALSLIDPSRIDQTIKTLVGYDTRNSLSSMEQMPAGKGVEAAAD
jgi:hypothetical protein